MKLPALTPRSCLNASVALYAAALPISISLAVAGWMLVALSLAAVLRTERRKPAVRLGPLGWLLLAYVGIAVLSAAFGVDPGRSLLTLHSDLNLAWLFVLFTAALEVEPSPAARWGLAAGFSVAALRGIEQTLSSIIAGGKWRLARGWVHHITYGELMFFALTGGLCALLYQARERPPKADAGRRAATAAFCLLTGTALLFSQARGAWLGFGAALLTVAFVHRRIWPWLGAGAGLVAAGTLFSPALAAPFWERFLSIFDPAQEANAIRLELWRLALRMFHDHPLLGVGPGNFRTLFNAYHPGKLGDFETWSQAHNLYLHQLAERGMLGLAALLSLLGAMWWLSLEGYRRRPGPWTLWRLALMSGFWVINLTQTSLQTGMIAMTVVFLWLWCERAEAREP